MFILVFSEALTHAQKCVTVGQGDQWNAVLLRGGLNGTQQVTALTLRRSAVLEEACSPSPLVTHSFHTLCRYMYECSGKQPHPMETKASFPHQIEI